MLARGWALRVAFAGGSMEPLLHPGDFLIVEEAPPRPRPGSVLLFRKRGILVAHRCIGSKGAAFLAKGDAADAVCETVSREEILGEVVGFERRGKRTSLRSGPFLLLGMLASLASPWLPALLNRMPRPVRRAALRAAGAIWNRLA